MRLGSIPLTLRTLSYLRPAQFYYLLRHRLMGAASVRPVERAEARNAAMPVGWLVPQQAALEPWEFRFLNRSKTLQSAQIEWQPQQASRLWGYNLHYFDYLQEPGRPESVKQAMLDSWIAANPQGTCPAWEPYTASLRISNWVKHFLADPATEAEARRASLYTQARWLRNNLERHLLANHYFENLKALVFAGVFFSGQEADGWLEFACAELAEQLREQTLADGGHYERTPAYHGVMLQNYMELYAVLEANQGLCPPALLQQLQRTISAGLAFLGDILLPGHRIPLLNDSAFNSSPPPAALFNYAEALGFELVTPLARRTINRPDTGIYGCVVNADAILVDCGEIGPDYQPGHTHCDFLSYELVLDGLPLVVDTGVYEYEPGAMRHYVRTTQAHNTIAVDGDEQSEVWGEFRVGNRARKLGASISGDESTVRFAGAMRGFYGLGGRVEHHRVVSVELEEGGIASIEIADNVLHAEGYPVESYIHIHPEVRILDEGGGNLTLRAGGREFVLVIPAGFEYRVQASVYCPEFGTIMDNQCIVIQAPGSVNTELSYQIRKIQ